MVVSSEVSVRDITDSDYCLVPVVPYSHLTDFRVRILDPEEATAAKTRVLIESSDGEATWGTVGVSGNIIEASWEALVDSVEYKLFREEDAEGAS